MGRKLEVVLESDLVGEVVHVAEPTIQAETACWREGMGSIAGSGSIL